MHEVQEVKSNKKTKTKKKKQKNQQQQQKKTLHSNAHTQRSHVGLLCTENL
jgi:hypothetical protein